MKINADDFGYSVNDNACIISCFKLEIINSTTIMVNSPDFMDAVVLSEKHSIRQNVGLHLNLTEFYPLTKEIQNNPRFVRNGMFYNNLNNRGLKSIFNFSKNDKMQVEKEIEMQMIVFRKYFPDSVFLDSHHHIHTVFPILKIVLKLAKKYGFTTLRLSQNIPTFPYPKKLYKKIINNMILKKFPLSYKFFTDTFYLDNIKHLKSDDVEIMVHPYFNKESIYDKLTQKDLKNIK